MEPRVTNLRIYKIDRHGQETKSNPHEMCIEVVIDNGKEKHTKKIPLAPTLPEFFKLGLGLLKLVLFGAVNERRKDYRYLIYSLLKKVAKNGKN